MNVPVAILTYGCRSVYESIESLINSTRIPLSVYIVNNSGPSSHHSTRLEKIQQKYNAQIIHCRNLWVLSLNHKKIQAVFNSSPYFIVTDDDILYPSLDAGDWLEDFLKFMHGNPNLGKLSLSLKWSESEELPSNNIPFPMTPTSIIERPHLGSSFYEFIGDTTPALYRSRLFSPNTNLFSPRHQKLIKPSLKGGVSSNYSCISLSNSSSSDVFSSSYASNKAICFALTSAFLSKDNLRRTPFFARLFYLAVRPLTNTFWLFHLFISHCIFILNLIQERRQ